MRPVLQIAVCLLLLLSFCEGRGHVATKPAVPKAPYGGSSAIYCNPVVIRQMEAAWMADANGTLRNGTWEYGYRVDYAFGQVQVGELVMGEEALRVLIPTNDSTVAIVHVHPINGVSTPSQIDLDGKWPNYVVSKDGLWVTNPRTHTYQFVRPFGQQFSAEGCPAAPPAPAKKSSRPKAPQQ